MPHFRLQSYSRAGQTHIPFQLTATKGPQNGTDDLARPQAAPTLQHVGATLKTCVGEGVGNTTWVETLGWGLCGSQSGTMFFFGWQSGGTV